MINKKISFILILLLFSLITNAQNSFEFHGKISIDDGRSNTVKIVVTKDGKPYKTFHPESNGKYSFNLNYNSVYIVSYEKKGFVSKKVEVNTIVPDKVLKNNNFKYKWKTDVNLFKKYEGIDFSFFNEPIQKIYFNNNASRRFVYDDKYAKQIEKELREKMAEVEKRKAEERKAAEKKRQQLLKERQQAIKDSLAQVREQKKQRELEYKQNQALRQKQLRDSIENAKIYEQKQKEQQALKHQQELKQKAEETRRKKEEEKKRLAQERADKIKQIKEAAEKRKAEKIKKLEELKALREKKRQQLLELNKKDITEENTVAQNRKIQKFTVKQGGIVNYYRKVVWTWGGIYYFRNNKSISRSVFYLETRE